MLMLEDLPNELLVHIFSFLTHQEITGVVSLINKRFNEISHDGSMWRQQCLEPKDLAVNKNRLIPPNDFTAPQFEWKSLYYGFGKLGDPADQILVLKDGISASTTDFHEGEITLQTIDKTLANDNHFWSSKGSADIDSEEWLLYSLIQPGCVVTAIDLHPFRAHFQYGSPTYAPQKVQILMGFSKEKFHFKSKIYTLNNSSDCQRIAIKPTLAIGSYLFFRLIGRNTLQPSDLLYYTVLRLITVWGFPIAMVSNSILRSSLFSYCSNFYDYFYDIFERFSETIQENISTKHQQIIELLNQFKSTPFDEFLGSEKYFSLMNALKEYYSVQLEGTVGIERERESLLKEIKELIKKDDWQNLIGFIFLHDNKSELQLRARSTLEYILKKTAISGIVKYFSSMIATTKLNIDESIYLVELVKITKSSNPEYAKITERMLQIALYSGKLYCNEYIGNIVKEFDKQLAYNIYIHGNCFDKIIQTSIEFGRFSDVLSVWSSISANSRDYENILSVITASWGKVIAYKFACKLLQMDSSNFTCTLIMKALEIDPREHEESNLILILRDLIASQSTPPYSFPELD